MKLHTQHGWVSCDHKWSKYPFVWGNLLAVLGCQIGGSTLFVQKLPVDSSTLGVTDNHSGCCCCIGTHVCTCGNHVKSVRFVNMLNIAHKHPQVYWNPYPLLIEGSDHG